MREILFRAKDFFNGKWVIGLLGYCNFIYGIEKAIYENEEFGGIISHRIMPKTVGQYTGFNDCHDKKIFEGDIIQLNCYKAVIYWDEYTAQFRAVKYMPFTAHSLEGKKIEHTFKVELDLLDILGKEIIGNIYDNPELLGKE